MKKKIKTISAQLQRIKEEENTSSSTFSLQGYSSSSNDNEPSILMMLKPNPQKIVYPRNLKVSLKINLGNLNQSVISLLWENLTN
jgi:hypothetical protein